MLFEALPEISEKELEHFFQIMLTKYGEDFRGYAPASLKRRLGTVLKRYGLPNMQTLNQRLLTQPEYYERFISEITVSTTELFRDPSAWVALKNQLVPLFASFPQVHIWHVGCSTGEEVLSVAILLQEMGLYDRTQIYATDIDRSALEQAQKATYPLRHRELYEKNLKAVLPNVPFSKYAWEEQGNLVFSPSLLRGVRFLRHNVVTESTFGKFEIILCRNLLIYLTPSLQDQVVTKLIRALQAGGIFMIGTKESLFWCQAAQQLIPLNEVERIYQKKP
ncbi:MAG: protein-glutamate O-methyltransferase CheR [Bacteroidia bacterium]|nr:protein-glutamate O-methyltransferase CheR [Bacteroidia bacterium]MDW8134140.1 protein-glutamate O-methyltransferase CheR [Bacteroidia bacterium]